MDRESSDDEEDRRNLIHQNDTTIPKSPNHHHRRSTFNVAADDFDDKRPINNRKPFNKRYIFAITLPILIVFIYFTTDFKSLFQTSFSYVKSNDATSVTNNRMRESELRALYLLRQQQLGLFDLWNHSSSLVNVKNSSSLLPEDVRSAVFNQISLNKQIQQVLLSSHQLGDWLGSNNVTDPSLSIDGGGCGRVDSKLSEMRTIKWEPKPNKYLFAICVSGQMSNHLICLEKHMFFAAVLNRVLVIPSAKVDYEFKRVLDIEHINKCLGREVVVTFEEFAERKKSHLHIDKVLCYFSLPQPCFVDTDHVKKLKSNLGISISKFETVWTEDVKKPRNRAVKDVTEKFSSNDDVLAIGDVFFADVEREWVMQPGGPIAHKCKTLVEPSRLIMLTAQRFIQTFLGKNFIALHFRRHGFLKFCNAKEPSCFFPIPQAAECINRLVERTNSPVIYLSTDAAESETGLLQSLVVLNGKTVPLVKRPARNAAEKWDALLYRHGLDGDAQVEAMLDKTICALSAVFIGSSGSTFTEDILRLRKDWRSASVCDEYLCQGELPNFIAEDE